MRKIILLLLLSMSVSLVACKEKEEPVNEVPVLLTETVVEKEESTPTQSAQTNSTQTSKPKPTYNSNNIIVVEEKQEEVVEVVEEVVEEEVPTVDELIEEEENNTQATAEELLNKIKNNTPMNYRMEFDGVGSASGGESSWKIYSDITNKVRHDYIVKNLSGYSVEDRELWYDTESGKIHTKVGDIWTTELVGKTFNPIDNILSNVKFARFVDSNSDTYIVEADLNEHTLGYNSTFKADTVLIYINKSSMLIDKIEYKLVNDFITENNLKTFELRILFGEYNSIELEIPESLTEDVVKLDLFETVSTMSDKLGSNYSYGIKYDDTVIETKVTGGNIYQTVTYRENGIPIEVYKYFDAVHQKTFVLTRRSTVGGVAEESEIFDGVFEYLDMKSYLKNLGNTTQINPVVNRTIAFTCSASNIVVPGILDINVGTCAVHANDVTGLPMYIELPELPDSLTDTKLLDSNRLITIYNIGTTDITTPTSIKNVFYEYYTE